MRNNYCEMLVIITYYSLWFVPSGFPQGKKGHFKSSEQRSLSESFFFPRT